MQASASTAPNLEMPFRVGTTSHIYPGGWLANARRLAFRVRDINLLCFDKDALPARNELDALLDIRAQAGLGYTVHMPRLAELMEGGWLARQSAVSSLRKIIAHTRTLEPGAYILHLSGADDLPQDALDGWKKRAAQAVRGVLRSGIEPHRLCVSCDRTSCASLASLAETLGISLAIDVSHWDDVPSLQTSLERHMPRIAVIEWHGIDPDGRDHRAVSLFPTHAAQALLNTLQQLGYGGVLTLKVLSEPDFEESMRLVTDLLHGSASSAAG